MANPNPNISGLEKGRGKRPKEDNESISMRLPSKTCLVLEDIAEEYGIYYGDKPWISGLLRKIGEGELMVVPASPDTKENIKKRLQERTEKGKIIRERMNLKKFRPTTQRKKNKQ
ncbi:hypothetical protein Lepto7376_3980 [[Leptolyngbya] sp. PCC 7376]|uniref:hypothetical protein n=1 Tax=[Leptolyngbya] sp. PCC 7376 TaxID=111781 RepID=UPI00029ED512|nr:hypothetical protein [[Leptolyngbya] sp. PCC 7376]AFY40120.1 hypothetical protein Lepto7376_3980 [[Leptolyngbya] sp. PCC 7376]